MQEVCYIQRPNPLPLVQSYYPNSGLLLLDPSDWSKVGGELARRARFVTYFTVSIYETNYLHPYTASTLPPPIHGLGQSLQVVL
jgi:hypothetical protein